MAVVPVATFRATFPEFSSTAAYPAPVVEFWLTIADLMLSATRWGRLRDLGMQLFAAHNIAIEKQAQKTAAIGGVPGVNTGPVSAKSVGPGSISYDTAAAMNPGASHWNLTTYGTRFIWMVNLFGAGPIQVGVGCTPWWSAGWGNGGAWPGPCPWPLPSGTGFSS